jgi:arylsulfatase A-like enzyme
MSKNVVLVVMDTARASDTSYVRDNVSESHLKRLASEGSDFVNTFSNSPWTLPSHASMFTGTYTSKHGTHAGHKSYDGQFPTLAELLSENGYQTVSFTNNAWVTDEFGLARGFDEQYKIWQYIQTETDFGEITLTNYGTDLVTESVKSLMSGDFFANLVNTVYGKFLYRRSDYGASRTNALIREWLDERDGERPFFMFVNYLEPHLDYQPPKAIAERFLPEWASFEDAMDVPQEPWEFVAGNLDLSDSDFDLLQALYRAEIAYLDNQIGQLRNALEASGEWEETVFVVVGDHGENIGDHGLMDHQYSVHDTLLHVPLIIEGGRFSGGGESNRLVQTLDLFPTVLDIAGVPVPSHSQGVSLQPRSSESSRDHVFAEYRALLPTIDRLSQQTGAPRDSLEKFDRTLRAIRTREFKLVRDSEGTVELFHVAKDPSERRDVSESNLTELRGLEFELDSWLESFDHASAGEATDMSESTKQKLENLGYLQ